MAAREVQMIVVRYFSTIRHQIPPSARIGRLAEFEGPSWLAHWGDKPELSVKVPRQVNRIHVSTEARKTKWRVFRAMGLKLASFYPANEGTAVPTPMAMVLLFRPETEEPLARAELLLQ